MNGVRTLVARTLVTWCPDWPVAAAGYAASDPVAVVFAGRVVASSAAARADGVSVGLRRREAQGRCPALVVVEQDLGRDARAFEPVAAAVEAFTPRVEVVRPGATAFATRGPSRYFGGDEALAAKVATAVDAVVAPIGSATCRVGIADGPFAAELAARAADRVRVVPQDTSAAFLAPFPVSTLDRPDLADLLVRLGLPTLGHVAALPADVVLARFGPEGKRAHQLAQGHDERPLAALASPPDLTVSAELDPPVDRVDMAAFTAKALADELHSRLVALGLACTRIAIEVETEHGEHLLRLWRHDGALTAGAVAERVRWQLDGWLSSGAATAGITLLRLIPDEVKPDHGRQLGFWGGTAAADDRAARALARVQGMLGPEGVVTAVIGGGRDPDSQVRLVPWGDPREPVRAGGPVASAAPGVATLSTVVDASTTVDNVATRPTSHAPKRRRRPRRTMGAAADEVPPWPGNLPVPAPAVVHLPPLPAEVQDGDGQPVTVSGRGLVQGHPRAISVAGGPWTAIDAWAGPWPAEERWWDPAASRRRARFQLSLVDGTAHLVVLEGGRWQVAASYD
jgi:protein ImuB